MPPLPAPARPRWLLPLLLAGGAAALCVAAAGQSYLGYVLEGEAVPAWGVLLLRQVPFWGFWALATPAVLALGRRVRFSRAAWGRALAAHLAAGTALLLLQSLLFVAWTRAFALVPAGYGFSSLLLGVLVSRLLTGLTFYTAILAVGYGLEYGRRLRERELQAAQLEGQLAQARLEALRMQLHPHFLFNALNTVAMLVRETGHRDALRVVVNLADLLRAVLRDGEREIPLREEVEFLERYLEIERVRFQDGLRVEMEVEPEAAGALIPRLLLQPLVENAVRHGVGRRREPGEIRLAARRAGERLEVRIRDNGPGLPPGATGEGVGLANVRTRLAQLFPGRHAFALRERPEGGVEAAVDLPFRPAGGAFSTALWAEDETDPHARRR